MKTVFARLNISVWLVDLFLRSAQIPEEGELFILTLTNVTGGARLGSALNASLQVNKNDDPIYFAGKHLTFDFFYAILRIPKMLDVFFAFICIY